MAHRPLPFILAAALALPLAACSPPRHAAITSCSTAARFGVSNPERACVMRVAEFNGNADASFSAEGPGFYRHYEADAEFSIERGSVLVRVHGSHDPIEFVIEPGRPWKGQIVARLNRRNQTFRISMEPLGEAGGLEARIRYRNVKRSLLAPPQVFSKG